MRRIIILGLCVFLLGIVKMNGEGENKDGSGIVFLTTTRLEEIKDFYIDRIGCQLWIDQGSCAILRYGNLLVGFCVGEKSEPEAVITFFYRTREEVDLQYRKFKSIAKAPPKENKKYRIYHFYSRDPDGRSIEFQSFLHAIDWDFKKK
ncbi:MAG: VOC family protein [Candidatus Aminicenantes bacterium]|nr:MAG: VOC family protein [Candidatus Aminicenantes bacterium]